MQWDLFWVTGLSCAAAQLLLTGLFSHALPAGIWRREPGFLAHQIISLVMMVIVSGLGIKAWFFPDENSVALAATAHGRVYGAYGISDTLASLLLGELIVWDIPMTFFPSLFSIASMGHHVGMAITIVICMRPYLMYYVPFFGGLIELSSVPLQIVDLMHPKHFIEWTDHPTVSAINGVARISFAVSFVVLRTLYFPYVVLLQVCPDLWRVSYGGNATEILTATVSASLALSFTALQLYWSVLLVRQVVKGSRKKHAGEKVGRDDSEQSNTQPYARLDDSAASSGYGGTKAPSS